MPLSSDIIAFCKKFARDIPDGTVAVFAGAGLSRDAGFVNWKELLAPFASELGLDIEKESDNLVRFAQYSQNFKAGNRAHLNDALITAFPTRTSPSLNHEILARLPIATYWTTNYDKLIETALSNAKKLADVKHSESQLPFSKPRRDAVVYKMHGDVDHPQDAILTRNDYESYSYRHPGFVNALIGDLTGKTFLFLGFSFTDPNLDITLSHLRLRYQTSQREHYCVLRKPKRSEFENDSDFIYSKSRQRHFIDDLKRYNVTSLLIDEYSDVTEILITIEKMYRRRSVFVSGSAESFFPWSEEEVNRFFRDLGSVLFNHNFRIVSGFGLGVGNSLISGAIESAFEKGTTRLDHFLDVRPFPRDIADKEQRDNIWHLYRTELLSLPGIALFFFGNKVVNGEIVPADGVRKEFDIAAKQGLVLIPISATGYMAQSLYEGIVNNEYNISQQNRKALERIPQNVGNISQLLQPIVDAMHLASSDYSS